MLAGRLMKLRRAEKRRQKQREIRRVRGDFGRDPFKTVKRVLNPSPVGELKCSKEELDDHLARTYGDPTRQQPLGIL